MSKRLTTEEFIRRARLMHGDKYDYSKSVYFDAKTKLTIICRDHGEFRQRPDAHLVGGCRLCGRESRKIKLHSLIERFNEIHECKYDYSLVEGEVSSENIKIICREHGVFTQRRSHHMAGAGCPSCSKNRKLTFDIFVRKSNIVHSFAYQYDADSFVNSRVKVKIICRKHGEFLQFTSDHMSGKGCPECADYGFKRTNKTAYVYFLVSVSAGAVKIGVTHNKAERIRKLTRDTPFQFDIIKIIKTNGMTAASIESRFHNEFQRAGFSGFDGCTEWVIKTPRLMMEIEKLTPQ